MMKRCVLFVVDALAEPIVREWISLGRLPNMATLIDQGGQISPCLSIFPSITPAATCSIATGLYPKDHGIEGACWFDPDRNDFAYFGDDLQLALREGLKEYLIDFGDRLNFERLRAPLVYEHVHESGMDSACINYMWFRGMHQHERTTPWMLRLSAGKLPPYVMGPRYLKLGDFVEGMPDGLGEIEGAKSGVLSRYGFHDQTTAAYTMAMAKSGKLPAMTFAYFPLNDDLGHQEGLHRAASKCVEEFDEFLGKFVMAVGGWDVVRREYAIAIVGDHGQTEWAGEDGPEIVLLDRVLKDFRQGDTAHGWEPGDQLVICPNMRAASVYLGDESCRDAVCRTLRKYPGIDQVIYEVRREGNERMYTVETNGRGRLAFARTSEVSPDDGGVHVVDNYGNRWTLYGELETLDLRIDPNGHLVEGEYPNPLERIEGAFSGGQSPIWVTADRDVEFAIAETSTHEGGSHGSLNHADTLACLVTSAGVDMSDLPNPSVPRIVDVMDLCLKSLGLQRASLPIQPPVSGLSEKNQSVHSRHDEVRPQHRSANQAPIG